MPLKRNKIKKRKLNSIFMQSSKHNSGRIYPIPEFDDEKEIVVGTNTCNPKSKKKKKK